MLPGSPRYGPTPVCEERASGGYASGMAEIFRQVAGVNPLQNISTASPWLASSRADVPSQEGEQEHDHSSVAASTSPSTARASGHDHSGHDHDGDPSTALVVGFAAASAVVAAAAAGAAINARKARSAATSDKVEAVKIPH